MKKYLVIIFMIVVNTAFSQQTFTDFQSFLKYTEGKSISLQNTSIKEIQAKKAKLAALIGIPDPQISLNGTFTDYLKLPVTLLPADAFGGQTGSVKAIEMGSPYTTSINQSAEIKLINFDAWQNYSLSKINFDLIQTDSKLTKKNLYENIAIAYYNIVLLQEQLKTTQKNIAVADSLWQITKNKFDNGLVKQQDVNDSRVNLLTLQENEKQINFQIKQGYLSLKILADIPENEIIIVNEIIPDGVFNQPEIQKNELSFSYYQLKEKYAKKDLTRQKFSYFPTLSFISGFQYNQYNHDFTIAGGEWRNNKYIGLKLSIPLPNSKTLSNNFNARYNYELAIQNSKQSEINAELNFQKLEIEWGKTYSQFVTNSEIANLQNETYLKNQNMYIEGILGLDKTLNSMNTMVNAEYNLCSSKVNMTLTKVKIDINNQIK